MAAMTRRRLAPRLCRPRRGCGAALAALLAFGGEERGHRRRRPRPPPPRRRPPPPGWTADEIALGPTVMVVEGLTVEDGEAVLAYDLFDINPVAPGRLREPDWLTDVPLQRLAEEAAVAPEAWTLITADGEIPGTTSGPRSRTARFSLPGGVLPEVLGLRLDRYWMRLPYAYEVGVPGGGRRRLGRGLLAVDRPGDRTDRLDDRPGGPDHPRRASPTAATPGRCSCRSWARGGPSPAAAPPPGCSWCTRPGRCPTRSASPPGPPIGCPSTGRCRSTRGCCALADRPPPPTTPGSRPPNPWDIGSAHESALRELLRSPLDDEPRRARERGPAGA